MRGVVNGPGARLTSARCAREARARTMRYLHCSLTAALLIACSDDGGGKKQESEPEPVAEGLPPCEAGDRSACGTFVSLEGNELPLGPYGAVMEPNVGEGFENPINPFDADGGQTCLGFSEFFGEDASQMERLPASLKVSFDLYTVYRPARWVDGEKYPVVLWGNGTCAEPESYAALLRYVASQGFFVIAPNARWVGGGSELLHALDFAAAANGDSDSPYHRRLDLDAVAAMGHSQGASGANVAARDARVKAAIIFNSGFSSSKPFLALSGEFDIGDEGPAPFADAVASSAQGAYLYYRKVPLTGDISGHLTLMLQPERVVEPTTAFLKYMLLDDEQSGAFFVGKNCTLCGHDSEYEFGQHGL